MGLTSRLPFQCSFQLHNCTCTVHLLLKLNALHERQYLPRNLAALHLQRNMPSIDILGHSIWEITLERLRTPWYENRIIFALDGQQRNLRLAEILLGRKMYVHVLSVVVEQIELTSSVLVALLILQEVQRPVG